MILYVLGIFLFVSVFSINVMILLKAEISGYAMINLTLSETNISL